MIDEIIILAWLILGLIMLCARIQNVPIQKRHMSQPQNLQNLPSAPNLPTFDFREDPWRRTRPYQRNLEISEIRTSNEDGRIFVENWRKSIVGLIKMAYNNLAFAKAYLANNDYKSVVEASYTSAENIARALIHCYGGKPDQNDSQEEALGMLSRRFEGDEAVAFTNAIENVARLSANKITLGHLSTRSIPDHLFDKAEAEQILESASTTINLFKQIIVKYFANEIPELTSIEETRKLGACNQSNGGTATIHPSFGLQNRFPREWRMRISRKWEIPNVELKHLNTHISADETCPKCHSLHVGVRSFNEEEVNYECNTCRHKWTGSR